jgi:signal transduction histidine kinase
MRHGSLPRLLLQFAVTGLLAVLVVVLGSTYLFRRAAQHESIRDARQLAQVLGRTVVQPHLRDGIVSGDPQATSTLATALAPAISDPVVRVKLWTREGRIVYSDEPRLVGQRFGLGEDELEVLEAGGVEAEVSNLSEPENRFERAADKLLEVYLPVHTPDGTPLLFETYLRYSSVASSARRLWLTFVPALVAGLGVLWLVQLPLAGSLARRLREGQREREELLLRSLDASDRERRRIAADVHDGVVQHLAGASFTLAGAAQRLEDGPARQALRDAAATTRQAVRELRSLLVSLHPPSLHGAGLEAALSDLLARADGASTLHVDRRLDLPTAHEQLVFRAVQEALRNVASHAGASTVSVELRAADGGYELVVADDGRGFDATERARSRGRGHLGLDLLVDRARDVGGELRVDSTPGEGTTLTLRGPRA